MKTILSILLTLSFSLGLAAKLSVRETDAHVSIENDGKLVLQYHKAVMPPPPGQPAVYGRSGFIHPIQTPAGGVVTGIHPSDHIHHMGLWHAWVNTLHDGRKLDFWNLKAEQATIRFVGTLRLIEDQDQAGFTVRQHHVALATDDQPEQVILKEDFTILVGMSGDSYVIDHRTVQTNVTKHPLEFPAYRYGGTIAYRAPVTWDKTNSDYLTSEGKNREDGHTTRSRWCAMYGPTEYGDATIVILGHPDNHDAPQRQRIWPEGNHGGKIFFNYVPVQEFPWSLEPGKPSQMDYRILVYDGRPDKKRIEKAWKQWSGR